MTIEDMKQRIQNVKRTARFHLTYEVKSGEITDNLADEFNDSIRRYCKNVLAKYSLEDGAIILPRWNSKYSICKLQISVPELDADIFSVLLNAFAGPTMIIHDATLRLVATNCKLDGYT